MFNENLRYAIMSLSLMFNENLGYAIMSLINDQ